MKLPVHNQYQTLALEAMAGESALKSALTRLPGFFSEVSKKFTHAVSVPIDAMFHRQDLAWAADQLQALPYADLRTQSVPAVPGLTTDYLTYTNTLSKAASVAGSVLEAYVLPLTDMVAKRLANPSILQSHAPDPEMAAFEKVSLKEITGWVKELSSQIDSHPTTALIPYGKLIKRNADWTVVHANVMIIHDTFAKDDPNRFKKAVDRLNDLLGTLIARISTDPDAYRVAGPSLTAIAEASYVAASYVEFYGLVYRRAVILDHAMDQLIIAVKKFH